MRASGPFDPRLVIADPNAQVLHGVLEKFCDLQRIQLLHAPSLNERHIIDAIRQVKPEFLFNAYSMQLLGPELLAVPLRGAINFHNAPLPRYRGVNVYSWALINGEREYGVTWHFMTPEIDGGDIVAQKMFEVRFDDTPTTLMQRGFDAGVESLAELLDMMAHDELRPRKQDRTLATYYSRSRLPNGGFLDFSWTFERLQRFARGLDFRPLPNTFVRPTASFNDQRFYAQSIRLINATRSSPVGRVTEIGETMIHVQASDGVVGLADLLDDGLSAATSSELARRIGLEIGSELCGPAREATDETRS
jgi:methionyl-tRNA formyltransferase